MYGEALLTWNQNPEANLAGYRVYYSTDGSNFNPLTPVSDVGLTATPSAPSVNFTGFPAYGVIYFTVKAYNSSNLESLPSNIVSKAIGPKLMPRNWP